MKHQLLQRSIVYHGRAFSVALHQLRLPDGRTRSYDVVEHNPAVTVVPLTAEGEVLFVRQFRVGSGAELLELPAGVLQDGEDPAEGAAREIREETGFAAGQLHPLGGFFMAPGYSTEYMHLFLATHLSPDPLPQDDDEFLQLVRLPAGRALAMALGGEIQGGKTLVALLLARSFLPL
uniref:NUDIX hydrolase n=1 Tax=Anaerolinea thermolimosa TaxID=229919 RepID=A0A7C4KJJ7_9CHLR